MMRPSSKLTRNIRPGCKRPFSFDTGGRKIQHAGFRCHDQLAVMGNCVAEGTQTVAVQHGAHIFAIGGQHHRRPVPGFHHAGVEFVEIFLLLRHGFVLVPRFGDHHQHGMSQVATGHYQQFKAVVEAGGVTGLGIADGSQLVYIIAVQWRAELVFAGVHPVDVAPQRVNLAVVCQIAVRMRQFQCPSVLVLNRECTRANAETRVSSFRSR